MERYGRTNSHTLKVDDTWITFPYDPVLICYRGSHSHGTYIPPEVPTSIDDIDLMALTIPPLDHYFGLEHWEGKDFWVDKYDIVVYNIQKFFRLMMKGNPNCVGILYTKPEHRLYETRFSDMMVENRGIFIGKKPIFDAFGGYARGQLKRMTHFDGLSGGKGYMGEKRKKLVEQFGYDVKNAAHLVRLIHMCKDFLQTGDIVVFREYDADMIMDIKQGKWLLEEVRQYADVMFEELETLYPLADIPEYPDRAAINNLLIKILGEYFYG